MGTVLPLKRRVGRPRTRTDDEPGEYVGFRAPRALKEQLASAAKESGRSLSTEAQVRLEMSFRDEYIISQLRALLAEALSK